MDKKTLAQRLDFANHHQNATPDDIRQLCRKVKQFGFHSAFVNPCYILLARELLGNRITVGTVVSFPLGQEMRDVKILSAIEAVRMGADELDVSMNVGLFKAKKYQLVLAEMKAVVKAAKTLRRQVLVKFIIETGWLTAGEIKKASQLVLQSGADFVKTCSGMGPRGATLDDVKLIKSAVGGRIRIKVAGGIHTFEQAKAFIRAGADRIGTSHAVQIVEEAKNAV